MREFVRTHPRRVCQGGPQPVQMTPFQERSGTKGNDPANCSRRVPGGSIFVTPIALSASRTGSTLHETRPGPGRLPKKSISAMKRSSVGRKRSQNNLSILIFSAGSDFEHEKTKRLEFCRKPNFRNSEPAPQGRPPPHQKSPK